MDFPTIKVHCLLVPTHVLYNRQYSSWREEGGKLPDGRHFKQFVVVDDRTGAERVVVVAEDSHRRDRRYTYMVSKGKGWDAASPLHTFEGPHLYSTMKGP